MLPQVAPLPSATVVTLTTAVIEADGATVTLPEPFKVAEVIVLVAYAGVAIKTKTKINTRDAAIYFRQNFDIENLNQFQYTRNIEKNLNNLWRRKSGLKKLQRRN